MRLTKETETREVLISKVVMKMRNTTRKCLKGHVDRSRNKSERL